MNLQLEGGLCIVGVYLFSINENMLITIYVEEVIEGKKKYFLATSPDME